jgi:hypothetical protein
MSGLGFGVTRINGESTIAGGSKFKRGYSDQQPKTLDPELETLKAAPCTLNPEP